MMIRYLVSGGQCDRPQQEHHQVAAQAQEREEELESNGDEGRSYELWDEVILFDIIQELCSS